jgi:shikimate dehydrogenase
MHNAAFASIGLSDWRYELWETPLDLLPERLREIRDTPEIAGANVTIPHKRNVIPYLNAVNEHARAIGAVNTIFKRERYLLGDNTDWVGFLADLAFHQIEITPATRGLVLGAGGSARAIVYALVSKGAHVDVCNRTPARVTEMIAALANSPYVHEVHDIVRAVDALTPKVIDDATLIVNCTSAGMWPNDDASPWSNDLPFSKGAVLYDLVYKPRVTKLMRQAEAAGLRVIGGIGMLAEQGAAAFEKWTGIPAQRVSPVMRAALAM